MPERMQPIRRAKRQRVTSLRGFIVRWDVDSHGSAMVSRVRRFVFGQHVERHGRRYAYPGFVERGGVRYLGQSVPFVTQLRLLEIRGFMQRNGVRFHATSAALGPR